MRIFHWKFTFDNDYHPSNIVVVAKNNMDAVKKAKDVAFRMVRKRFDFMFIDDEFWNSDDEPTFHWVLERVISHIENVDPIESDSGFFIIPGE